MFTFLALYIWPHTNSQVSPDEPLSLEDFACRTVSVSFVVVNKFGVSQESPPLTLNVPGGIYTVKPLVLGTLKDSFTQSFPLFGCDITAAFVERCPLLSFFGCFTVYYSIFLIVRGD